MFVDASAIVAILTEEAEAQALAGTLESAREPITSPIAVWEAAASISRNRPATKAQRHKEKIDVIFSTNMTHCQMIFVVSPFDKAWGVEVQGPLNGGVHQRLS